MKFACWNLSEGEDVDDAQSFEADDIYEAAEHAVESWDCDGANYEGDISVAVRSPDGTTTLVDVTVEFTKSYNGFDAPLADDPENQP